MIKFIFKFTKNCFLEQKKEMFFVLIGMVLCVFVVLNFTGSVFGMGDSPEKLHAQNQRVIFTFDDLEHMKEVLETVNGFSDIEAVFLRSTDVISSHPMQVMTGKQMPFVEEETMVTGHMPQSLAPGEIVISLMALQEMGRQKTVAAAGERLKFGSREFTCIAQVNGMECHLLMCEEDFFSMYEQYGEGNVELYYIYPEGFSDSRKEEVRKSVEHIKTPVSVREAQPLGQIAYSDFVESIQDLLLGMIIAILNAMFLYGYVLNSRIASYSILKLQGVSNGMLRAFLFSELLVLYLAAFLLSGSGYAVFLFLTGNVSYNTGKIYLYTFFSLLVLNLAVFCFFIHKLMKQQPFEIYRKQRG